MIVFIPKVICYWTKSSRLQVGKKYNYFLILVNTKSLLPDKLSDIVNTGIQQGGVENAVPVAIRESEMNKVIIFMNNANKTLVLDKYKFMLILYVS